MSSLTFPDVPGVFSVELAVRFSRVEEEMFEVTRTGSPQLSSRNLLLRRSASRRMCRPHFITSFSCFHRHPKSLGYFSPKLVSFLMWSQRSWCSQRSAITHLAGVNARRSTPTVTRQDGPHAHTNICAEPLLCQCTSSL